MVFIGPTSTRTLAPRACCAERPPPLAPQQNTIESSTLFTLPWRVIRQQSRNHGLHMDLRRVQQRNPAGLLLPENQRQFGPGEYRRLNLMPLLHAFDNSQQPVPRLRQENALQ